MVWLHHQEFHSATTTGMELFRGGVECSLFQIVKIAPLKHHLDVGSNLYSDGDHDQDTQQHLLSKKINLFTWRK